MTDSTEARIAELETQLADARRAISYQTALCLAQTNTAYDILIVVDNEHRVITGNAAAQDKFDLTRTGVRLGEATGIPALETLASYVLESPAHDFEDQINLNERIYRVRVQVLRMDTHEMVGIALQDITQLIRLNRARRDMVANISHELRTPIANIRLIIDSLFHAQDKPKRKESITSLRAIARETDALLWLVQEMADLSMIESGQAIVRMVEVPLVEVINAAAERLVNQSQFKQINIVTHIPDKLHVLCDRDLMQRVVVNLLHNAMKWSPTGDAITVTADAQGEETIISVLDNGPGVPAEQVERIFERFYQVDASRSGTEGTGLGLAICKHIVVAHGGRIWAESNADGAGGRFRFTLLSADVERSTDAII